MIATLKGKKLIAENTLQVTFDISDRKVDFQPGQYFFVTILKPRYTDARGNQRHFTIVNSPHEKGIITLATRLRNTAFKRSLNRLNIGDQVMIDRISGDFLLPDDNSRFLVFIAGGIGITPFISMLRFLQEEKLDYKVMLLYSNKNKEATAFFEELGNMDKQNPGLKVLFTMSHDFDWKGEHRLINTAFIREHVPDIKDNLYYVSGPPALVEAVYLSLLEMGVAEKYIKTENFSGY